MYVIDIRFASLGLDCFWCWEISVFFFFFLLFLGWDFMQHRLGGLENAPRLARGHIHSKAHGGSASMVGLTQ